MLGHIQGLVREVATCLIELLFGTTPLKAQVSLRATAAQVKAYEQITSACRGVGAPPMDLDAQGALSELLGRRSYSRESCTVVPLDVSRSALPTEGFMPIPLLEVGPAESLKFVEGLHKMLCQM